MRYRTRLIVYFCLILVIPVGVSVYLSMTILRRELCRSMDTRIAASAEDIANHLGEMKRAVISSLKVMHFETELLEFLDTGNREPLVSKLEKFIGLGGFDLLEVGGVGGVVIGRGHNPDLWGENKLNYDIIKHAIAGDASVDFEFGKSGPAIRAVRPILSNGQVIGTVMGGYAIDLGLARRERRAIGLEAGFYLRTGAVHSTIPLQSIPAHLAERVSIDGFAMATIDTGATGDGRGGLYRIALKAIRQNSGAYVGLIAAGERMEEGLELYRQVLRILSLNLLVGVVLSFISIWILSKGLSKPMEKLQEKMKLLGDGDFSTRFEMTRSDEFGVLEVDFNKMATHLEDLTGKVLSARKELIRKEKLALAGAITAEVAHEIRNPLNSLAALIELLRKDLQNGDTQRGEKRIALAREEIDRLSRTITGFLTTYAPARIHISRADICETLRRALIFTEKERMDISVALTLDLEAESLTIPHDREQFYTVFLNLIKNACESMKPGGALSISVRTSEEAVSISFKDDGCGISDEEKERIFDLYFSTKETGTGIGLARAIKIVEAHGGKIEVDSLPGKGTMISIHLPLDGGLEGRGEPEGQAIGLRAGPLGPEGSPSHQDSHERLQDNG